MVWTVLDRANARKTCDCQHVAGAGPEYSCVTFFRYATLVNVSEGIEN
jgi:hypothetical protein